MAITTALFNQIATMLHADKVTNSQIIQPLWGGYGKLFRAYMSGYHSRSVIVKYIEFPNQPQHPRGWNTLLSHQRKLTSYEVESRWYQDFASKTNPCCPMPQLLAVKQDHDTLMLVMEDLALQGFTTTFRSIPPSLTHSLVSEAEIQACLSWLAHFHAEYIEIPATGLWPIGGYWHLQTRPDELEALSDHELKAAAETFDQRLQDCQYQTLIHGDAKLANFCFNTAENKVAAVDFQYVGKGCGIKDIVLFISSCIHYQTCEQRVPAILNYYFKTLRQALTNKLTAQQITALETEWRQLYEVSWADFQRFMKGWNPDNWKINPYSEQITQQALSQLMR